MLININHLLLFIFFSTSFILLVDAHLLLLSCYAHLFFRIFLAGQRHVSLSDYSLGASCIAVRLRPFSPGALLYRCQITPILTGSVLYRCRITPILTGSVMYRCPITPVPISAFVAHSISAVVTLFACCVCLNFRCVHSPVATLLPSTSGCEWGGMLAGTLVYPPGLCGFAASC